MIQSNFHEAAVFTDHARLEAYDDFFRLAAKSNRDFIDKGSPSSGVARTIYRAATARNRRFRYLTGANARLMMALRRVLPFRLFRWLLRLILLK